MAANDASGQGLQSAPKNRHQNNFSRKLWVKNPFSHFLFSCYTPFPTYDPHTILKKCTDEMNYNYFYIYLQNLKMGANDASGEGLQYATKNRHQNIFPRKLWRINPGFFCPKEVKSRKSLFSMKIRILEKQGLLGQKTRVNSS